MSESRSMPTNVSSSLVLALTLLLGASLHVLSAVVYSFLLTLTMVAAGLWVNAMGSRWKRLPLFYSTVAIVALMVTLFDVILTFLWPEGKKSMGIYLPLLALNPLLYTWTDSTSKTVDIWIGDSLKLSAQFAGLTVLLACFRDFLGEGQFLIWKVFPVAPIGIAELSSGAFLLAAAGIVVFRAIQNRKAPLPQVQEKTPPTSPSAPPPQPEPIETETVSEHQPTVLSVLETPSTEAIAPAAPAETPPAPEQTAEKPAAADAEARAEIPWGESLEGVFESLQTSKSTDKKRILVIGSGTGELVYYLAMLGLEAEKSNKNFQFRVRGVDAFASRVTSSLEGIFREHQLDFVPFSLKQTYLLRSREGDKHLVRVANGPRIHIEFEVADFLKGRVFFYKPCDVIVVEQSLEYLSPEKLSAAMQQIDSNLVEGGAFVLRAPIDRNVLPPSFKRTGTQVFRKK